MLITNEPNPIRDFFFPSISAATESCYCFLRCKLVITNELSPIPYEIFFLFFSSCRHRIVDCFLQKYVAKRNCKNLLIYRVTDKKNILNTNQNGTCDSGIFISCSLQDELIIVHEPKFKHTEQ